MKLYAQKEMPFSIHLVDVLFFSYPFLSTFCWAYTAKKASYKFGVCGGSRTQGKEDVGKLLIDFNRKYL